MKPNEILEFGMDLPYSLPDKTRKERAVRCALFIPAFILGGVLFVVAAFITIPWAIVLYIKGETDK